MHCKYLPLSHTLSLRKVSSGFVWDNVKVLAVHDFSILSWKNTGIHSKLFSATCEFTEFRKKMLIVRRHCNGCIHNFVYKMGSRREDEETHVNFITLFIVTTSKDMF